MYDFIPHLASANFAIYGFDHWYDDFSLWSGNLILVYPSCLVIPIIF